MSEVATIRAALAGLKIAELQALADGTPAGQPRISWMTFYKVQTGRTKDPSSSTIDAIKAALAERAARAMVPRETPVPGAEAAR